MTTADLERIGVETGVSAVLSVQHDDCLACWDIDYPEMRTHGEDLGLRMARRPMRDFDIPDQRRHLALAVSSYSGRWTQANYREQESQLLAAVEGEGLTSVGAPVYARYNSPFSLWFLRRNEVVVEVEPSP
jgi:hypothetical protein